MSSALSSAGLSCTSCCSVLIGGSSPPRGCGTALRARRGAAQGWGEGVRSHNRGLATFVFVPWEELDSTELNLSAEEMDYYVPG